MNLIDRYVEAVISGISNNSLNKEDVGQELISILQQKQEAMEEEKGASLTEDEISEMLKDYGHPFKVACTYSKRRELIGENAYPLFKRALPIVLSVYMAAVVVLMLVRMQFSEEAWGLVFLPRFLVDVGEILLFGFFFLTVIFHYFGDFLDRVGAFWKWDPKSLPNMVDHGSHISFMEGGTSVVSTVFYLLLLTVGSASYTAGTWLVEINDSILSSIVILKFMAAAALLVSLFNLYQRYWTFLKLMLVAAIGVVSALLLINIVTYEDILMISPVAGEAVGADTIKEMEEVEGVANLFYIRMVLVVIIPLMLYRAFKRARFALALRSKLVN